MTVKEQAQIQTEIDATGDVGEAAYWHFKMRTDPTQQGERDRWGIAGQESERDAFKVTMRLFGPFVVMRFSGIGP